MGTKKIKNLFENWDQFDELETEKIIRKHTNNYNNHSAIKAIIDYFKNTKNGLELDIKNFSTVDKITGKASVWSLNYDKLGDVEFFINDKEYDEEYSFSTLKKIISKNQLGEIIDELEKKINPSTHPEPENKNPFPLIFTGIDNKNYTLFKTFANSHIIDKYIDFSFIFQQMKFNGYISDIKHLKFMDWLKENNYLNESEYSTFIIEKSFRSLKKCAFGTRLNLYLKLQDSIILQRSDLSE